MTGNGQIYRWMPWHRWLALLVGVLLAVIFADGVTDLFSGWESEEYSYGYLIPLLSAFLAWQQSTRLMQLPLRANWPGLALALVGLVLCIAGELGTLYTLIQYGLLVTIGGGALALMGWQAFRLLLPAYLLLYFMVPLPQFVYHSLSSNLQLISSQLGVLFIRAFGIAVYLEGNVIDLGSYQLQVAEACSGLRYLFPLSALGFIAAVFFRGPWWQKVTLFLSALPITILMNSFRIGVIGILVDRVGSAMVDGFLHDFEGWAVFMVCSACLVLEMWLFARFGSPRLTLAESFAIQAPTPLPCGATVVGRRLPWSFYLVLPPLAFTAFLVLWLPHREELLPEHPEFIFFPAQIGVWRGRPQPLGADYVDALKFEDYLLSDYVDAAGESVNLYVAYYASQRKGASVHSPKSCLPGGGWQIEGFSQREIADPQGQAAPLRVNRALIGMGDERLLVYYWFQQRGRLLTNEYLVKWYLLWDAIGRNRTDGALVRLVAPAPPGSDLAREDARLTAFAAAIRAPLRRFIPE